MPREISPSLLSADFTRLKQQIAEVEAAGANRLHLDVMDGHFVPNLTFGPFIVEAIRRLSSSTLDTHLMIEKPHEYIPQFIDAGSDTIIVHCEVSEDLQRDLAEIRLRNAAAGVAVNPDTDLDILLPHLGHLDYLLIMSVFPGFGGQHFIDRTLAKMDQAVRIRDDNKFVIAVDGGVNLSTVETVFRTGIDIGVVGSGLFEAADIGARLRELQG